jgi:hypothetical protein
VKRTPLRRTSRLAPSGPWARPVPLLRDHEKTKIAATPEAGNAEDNIAAACSQAEMDSSQPTPATTGAQDTGSE